MSELAAHVYIDLRPDAHEGVFDPEWAGRLFDRTRDSALAEHVFALCELWKSTSNAFRMPWFLLLTLNSFHDGFFSAQSSPALELIRALVAKLAHDPTLGLRRMQVQKLTKMLQDLDRQATTLARSNPPKFDREQVWKEFAHSKEFALGTAGLREMCHNNLLFGYEHYWKSCLDALPLPASSNSTKSTPTILERFADRFGKELCDQVHDPQIMLAREVRHAFVHRGGRVDQKLRDAGVDLPLGAKVTITVDVIRSLSERLRDRVDLLTDASLTILNDAPRHASAERLS